MADISKLLFYNTDNQLQNTTEADSMKYTSYKTENYELTDTLLGQLTNDVILRDGTRAFNANQSMGNNRITNLAIPTGDNDAATKKYVDDAIGGLSDFKEDVISKDVLDPPPTPNTGDRYLIGTDPDSDAATGAWTGQDGYIAEWNGTAWEYDTDISNGSFVYVNDVQSQYVFNEGPTGFEDGEWVLYNSGTLVGGDGIDITNRVVSVDFASLAGLKFVGGQLAVEPEHLVDGVSLVDNGSDQFVINFADTGTEMGTQKAVAAVDLSSNAANQGAKIIGFDPTNVSQTNATDTQQAIEDAFSAIEVNQPSVTYTAGVTITAGDVVYITSNDIVAKYPVQDPSAKWPIGAALSSVVAASSVRVAKSNATVAGAFTGKTAGVQLYWNSLTGLHEETALETAGYAVIRSGYAKNSTDLQVDVELLRVNG